jgi:hypothetical protein
MIANYVRLAAFLLVSVPFQLLGAQPATEPAAVVELIEDDTGALIKQLQNDGGLDQTQIRREFRDFYSGVSSIRVTPFQRFASRIQGWNYSVVEKPAPGQYRYLRFAWKRLEGPGIMIQFYSTGSWNQRYLAGIRSNLTTVRGPALTISKNAPREWTVVTRDLFQDFGPMTLTGFALTPMDGGGVGLFDHFYLGRTIDDLDRASAEAFGKTPLKGPLTLLQFGELWDDLASDDVAKAGPALLQLTAGRQESVPHLVKMLRGKRDDGDLKKIARWIDELDHDEFAIREAAFGELDKRGVAAIAPLQAARPGARSVEQRNRIDALLKNRGAEDGALTNEQLRLVRAIRVLEWAEASSALDALAKEPPDAQVLPDIQAARERLAKVGKR